MQIERLFDETVGGTVTCLVVPRWKRAENEIPRAGENFVRGEGKRNSWKRRSVWLAASADDFIQGLCLPFVGPEILGGVNKEASLVDLGKS